MKARKRGNQWEICYRCPGHPKPFYERFTTEEEANLRIAKIEFDKARGQLHPPVVTPFLKKDHLSHTAFITVSELLDEYVEQYRLSHWSVTTLSYNQHRIDDYIKPYIGNLYVQDLTTRSLDHFYNALQDTPAVLLKGHRKKRNIAPSVIQKVHAIMRSALGKAVAWGYIQVNPAVNCTPPEYEPWKRKVWTAEEAQHAIDMCDDPLLKTCMLIAIGCSARIGEILGLTWDCIDLVQGTDHEISKLCINKELKRCDKVSLSKLVNRSKCKVYFTFPEQKSAECSTVLVLKDPKNSSSVRTVYIPQTVADHLIEVQKRQESMKQLLGEAYHDYGLVIAFDNGTPVEERMIAKKLKDLIEKNDLPPVVFHSLRHCSTTMKLKLSGGNIKAVQGDTGHAQARMVTEIYAHMQDADRLTLAQKMEQEFFQRGRSNSEPATADSTINEALKLLTQKPELAKLLIALQGGNP